MEHRAKYILCTWVGKDRCPVFVLRATCTFLAFLRLFFNAFESCTLSGFLVHEIFVRSIITSSLYWNYFQTLGEFRWWERGIFIRLLLNEIDSCILWRLIIIFIHYCIGLRSSFSACLSLFMPSGVSVSPTFSFSLKS